MDNNGADIVRMGFEGGDLLRGVVIVNSNLEIIGSADDPILPGDEATCPYGDIGKFERFDDRLGLSMVAGHGWTVVGKYLRLVGPDVDMT